MVIFLEAAIVFGAMWIGVTSRNPYSRLVGTGFGAMVGFQAFVNIGMTLGILPITGLTLPFVSFGGSSIVASWIAMGILFSMAARDAKAGGTMGGSAIRGNV